MDPKIGPTLYVGTVSARVRDELWHQLTDILDDGLAVLIHPTNNEQGFTVRTAGNNRYQPIDLDGLTLMLRPERDERID